MLDFMRVIDSVKLIVFIKPDMNMVFAYDENNITKYQIKTNIKETIYI